MCSKLVELEGLGFGLSLYLSVDIMFESSKGSDETARICYKYQILLNGHKYMYETVRDKTTNPESPAKFENRIKPRVHVN